MDLDGTWLAASADEDLRRSLPDAALDDGAWDPVPVPGQWRSSAAFAASDGPVLYRHRFAHAPEAGRSRWWLTFDGLFYEADVWLDGSYLGDTEGYFAPQTFEVTEHLARAGEHLLAVELACAPPADRGRKHNLTGVFQHWDAIDPAWNPGGIWGPVRVTSTGPVRLEALRVLCREANDERAVLDLQATLDADVARTVQVATRISPAADDPAAGATTVLAGTTDDHELAAGRNRVRWRVTVDRPALWWPAALGGRPLHDVAVEVATGGLASDRRVVTTGLRQIRLRDYVATINGERLFLKGANLGPTRRALAEVTAADVAADLDLARRAGLDLLRVHAHIGHPELYRQADRVGMLLWQDLPLQWGYGRIRRQAVRQARQAVDLLGHHPALVLWCGHDEPGRAGPPTAAGTTRLAAARAALSPTLPGWNRTGLDGSLRRALERADASRPVVAHAGVPPHPAGGTDTHLALGWDHGDERDLPGLLARWPVLARFVGSFGTPSVPPSAGFAEPDRWPELDWAHLAAAHGLDLDGFRRRLPPDAYDGFEAWRDAGQQLQATIVRHHVETLRRLKYRPTGGFCHALLVDAQAAVSRALVDHERVEKPAFAALAAACRPVIVVADRPAPAYAPGAPVELDVHAVSDLRTPIDDVKATATLSWPGGSRTWRFGGGVPADSCVRIGRVSAVVPPGTPDGPLRLTLALRWTDPGAPGRVSSVTNDYASRVSTGPRRERGHTLRRGRRSHREGEVE